MKGTIYLLAMLALTLLLCGQAMAEVTNSCDSVTVSFDKQEFVSQAEKTSLTEAVKTAKANGGTAQEIICASVGIDNITTADIINALLNAGFDPVVIRDFAAIETGLDLDEVDDALTARKTPSTDLGQSTSPNASPSVP